MVFFKKAALYLLLLPVFFVFNGFTANYDYIGVADALWLILIYMVSAVILAWISWLFYRDLAKACLFAFALLSYYFFFGSIHDMLKSYFPGNFLSHYAFILPFSGIAIILFFTWLRKKKNSLQPFTSYLNLLLVLLVLADAGWLTIRIINKQKNSLAKKDIPEFISCDTCRKPDIYFIILDEYSGNTALKERFGFDNTPFENELSQRGFQVIDSSNSNYNSTPYSMASIFNMDYLDIDAKAKGPGNLNYCYRMIRDNKVITLFTDNGYHFYNYSIFDFKGHPTSSYDYFLPTKSTLITSQTFLSRVWKDILSPILVKDLHFTSIEKKTFYSHLHNIEDFMKQTTAIVTDSAASPKFVYTHLMMPHYPHYFDSKGKAIAFDSLLQSTPVTQRRSYLEYLQYCNQKILQFTDDILARSPHPPIIILAGDHGFKYIQKTENRKYCFMNLLTIYLPGSNDKKLDSHLAGVNLFRIIFNRQFGQRFPLLRDSVIYLGD